MSTPTVDDLENSGCYDFSIIDTRSTLVLICKTVEQASKLYDHLKNVYALNTRINEQGFPVIRVTFKNQLRLNIPVPYIPAKDPIMNLLVSGKINKITAGIFDSKNSGLIHSFEPDLPILEINRSN